MLYYTCRLQIKACSFCGSNPGTRISWLSNGTILRFHTSSALLSTCTLNMPASSRLLDGPATSSCSIALSRASSSCAICTGHGQPLNSHLQHENQYEAAVHLVTTSPELLLHTVVLSVQHIKSNRRQLRSICLAMLGSEMGLPVQGLPQKSMVLAGEY